MKILKYFVLTQPLHLQEVKMATPYRERSLKKYSKNLFGMLGIGAGAALIIEHIHMWGEFTFYDFIGHEWLGLLLILAGIILNLNLSKKNLSKELRSTK